MKIERVKIKIGRRSYTVVRAGREIVRIEALNAVRGIINLDLTGATAKRVRKALES